MPTDRQRQVYAAIRQHLARHGVAPKLAELGRALGIRSRGVVHRHVHALVEAGLLEVDGGRHRGIRLAGATAPAGGMQLPLLGRIVAGRPLEAVPDESTVDLSGFFMGPGRFVLRVQGDSMVEAGILDGDMVVVRQAERAADGDIVVALIDDEEATLKRIRHNRDGSVTLLPANRALAPMLYPAARVRIQGVVVAQLRAYR
ncbi:MAG TPA: transcriptional repressor LexA [Gammaproteobacteria bacterium]